MAATTGTATDRTMYLLAIIMLLAYVTLQVAATQLSSIAFLDSKTFRAPLLFLELKMIFRALAFPIYLLVNTCVKLIRKRKIDIHRTIKRSMAGFTDGDRSVPWSWKHSLIKIGPSVAFALSLQICYTLSGANIPTAAATAVFSITVEISYLLSWLVLGQQLFLIKTIFVLISFAGVALVGYASFSGGSNGLGESALYVGVFCGIGAAISMSLFQLAFRRAFPSADLGQSCFIVTIQHLLQSVIFAPVPAIAYYTGLEVYNASEIPIGLLIPSWFGYCTATIVYTYGLVLSSPFFMSMAELVILAANSVIDPLLRKFPMTPEQIIGTCLIAVAFLVMVQPNSRISVALRRKQPPTLGTTESTIELTKESGDIVKTGIDTSEMTISDGILPSKKDRDMEEDSDEESNKSKRGYELKKF